MPDLTLRDEYRNSLARCQAVREDDESADEENGQDSLSRIVVNGVRFLSSRVSGGKK
jgi:hypothetical protein